jgi:hypothetical protein
LPRWRCPQEPKLALKSQKRGFHGRAKTTPEVSQRSIRQKLAKKDLPVCVHIVWIHSLGFFHVRGL